MPHSHISPPGCMIAIGKSPATATQQMKNPTANEISFCHSKPVQKVLSWKFKSAILMLALTIGSSAWSEDPPSSPDKQSLEQGLEKQSSDKQSSDKPSPGKPGTLEGQATVLQDEAKKLDQSMKSFNLHAETYNRSKIHELVLQHQRLVKPKAKPKTAAAAASSTAAQAKIHANQEKTEENSKVGLTPETPQLSPSELQSRIETVHKLHQQFESHVTQLRGLVDQYRNFYNLYATHYDQFKGQLQDYKLQAEKAQLDLSKPKFELGATKQAANLAGAEKTLAVVLKKMIALEEESPNLSENYLCPAFDDLQKEFVVALAGLTTSIRA